MTYWTSLLQPCTAVPYSPRAQTWNSTSYASEIAYTRIADLLRRCQNCNKFAHAEITVSPLTDEWRSVSLLLRSGTREWWGFRVKLPGTTIASPDETICNGEVGPRLRHAEEWRCRSWRYISMEGSLRKYHQRQRSSLLNQQLQQHHRF